MCYPAQLDTIGAVAAGPLIRVSSAELTHKGRAPMEEWRAFLESRSRKRKSSGRGSKKPDSSPR